MSRRRVAPGRSCLECRRRKIKCDREFPCGYCVKIRNRCEYPHSAASKEPESHDVMAYVKPDQSMDVGNAPSSYGLSRDQPPSHPVPHLQLDNGPTQTNTQSHESQNDLRTRHSDQLMSSFQVPSLSFPTNITPPTTLHPPTAKIQVIWEIYLSAVDPFLKLFHVPSIQKCIMEFTHDQSSIDPPMETLLFAIYYATIMTMSRFMCWRDLHEDKFALLKRFRTGVEQSLCRANFLRSRDLVVLQALVLYLTFARNDQDAPEIPPLIGIAVGISMRMGLGGQIWDTRLSLYEVELRRRLWWHLSTLDAQVSVDHGIEPALMGSVSNVEMPLNTNDSGLSPNMSARPDAQLEKTEMLFNLIKFHIGELTRRVLLAEDSSLTASEKLQLIDHVRGDVEKRYTVHYDAAISLDFVTIVLTRMGFLKLKFAVCKPLAHTIDGLVLGLDLRALCRDILRQSHALRQCGKKELRWSWLIGTRFEWDVMAYSLLDICFSNVWDLSRASAWGIVDKVYDDWRTDVTVVQDTRWAPIDQLHSEALTVREKLQTGERMSQSSSTNEKLRVTEGEDHEKSPDVMYQELVGESSNIAPQASDLCRVVTTDQWSAGIVQHYLEIVTSGPAPTSLGI